MEWDAFAPTPAGQEALEARIAAATPLARVADPDDVARAALFLLSDDARQIAGTKVVVDSPATQSPAGAPVYRTG